MWLNKCSRTQIWTHHPYSQCILHVESKLKYRLFFILLDHIIRFWQKSLSLFPFLGLLKSDVVHFSHSIRRIEGHIRLELVQVNKSFELIHSSQWHSALFELLFERFQVGERSKTHYFSNFSSGLVEFVNKRMLSNCNLTINLITNGMAEQIFSDFANRKVFQRCGTAFGSDIAHQVLCWQKPYWNYLSYLNFHLRWKKRNYHHFFLSACACVFMHSIMWRILCF